MAMTINPANDFAIKQHNQAQTKPGLEKPTVRVRAEDNSGTQSSGKAAADSVELSSAVEKLPSAHSRLADFDQAQKTMATLKNNIHQQSGRMLQSQANISTKTAQSLLEE
jgi:flagellin-like hook-associated protein FlgL